MERNTVATKRKRLTLDIEEGLQRRLKAAAALQGISMREFCEGAFEDAVSKQWSDDNSKGLSNGLTVAELIARSRERLGGRRFPGNSADIIREERELRTQQIENRGE